jgi:hypothetical protein
VQRRSAVIALCIYISFVGQQQFRYVFVPTSRTVQWSSSVDGLGVNLSFVS